MRALQAADRRLGGVACVALQPLRFARALRRRKDARAERVLLIKFWGIGSLQLITPAVTALRRRHPRASLALLTLAQNADYARGLGAFDDVIAFDVPARSWARTFARILSLVRTLRAGRYAAVYDFEFFTRFSAVMALLSGAPVLRGFASPAIWRGGFHTETVPFHRAWHVARNFRALAGGENGADVTHQELSTYAVKPEDELEAAAALFEAGLALEGPLVVLNPNAGALSLERRWPRERFAELARALAREDGARVVLIGSEAERGLAQSVATLAGDVAPRRLANLAGRLSVGGLHALLESAGAFVTNDSGPMHLGAALGTPTIGLFGPETPVMYRPLGARASFLYEPPACSPCINVHDNKLAVCWRGRAECMTSLSVERVLACVRAELARGRGVRSRAPLREATLA